MKTFAAIYIGSYEISMKVFELSIKRGIREIDHVRHRIELGRDVYSQGYVGYETADELCQVLKEFVGIMEMYRTDEYEAYSGLVIRDAQNEAFILDQIRIRTGLNVKVLSNAAVVDVGGGSMQITLFVKGKVVTTQHLLIGIMRVQEKLFDLGMQSGNYEQQIQEVVDKELEVFKALYLPKDGIRYVIFMGDYISAFMPKISKENGKCMVDADKFYRYTEKLRAKNTGQIARELGITNESDTLLIPALVIYRQLVATLNAQNVVVPGVNVNDGIAYDYAQRHNMVKATHDFEEDVISVAECMSKRYFGYQPHLEALEQMAVQIFDAMKKIHGLGNRERLMLRTAAILHDCGKFVSLVNGPQCSYDIIISSEIIGLTHLEREIVASTVLYNTLPIDSYDRLADKMDHDSYLTVAKLAAILKVANAMDRSHKQKFKNVKTSVSGRNLIITIETEDDVTLEKGLFESKASFFEEVFSMKPVIKVKKVYS